MTEDEMVGWHHQLNGHEFEETLGYGEGQGSLMCCSPWGHKESDTTERLNNFSRSQASHLFLRGERGEGALWDLFYKDTYLIHDLITSQRPYFLIPLPWALSFQ